MSHRLAFLVLVLSLAATVRSGQAQQAPARADGIYLTVFRSPATGVELRKGVGAIHAGFYPTILKADGQSKGENTNFVRVGASAYLRQQGWTPYISPALLFSLDDDWANGVISEVGVRVPVRGRAAFRLGVGVLTAFDGEVRVNPTVGLDFRIRGQR